MELESASVPPASPPETELVRRAQGGDLAAFEQLVNRHERVIYSLALRIVRHPQDAEDVTQQAFLSALEGLTEFREEAAFGTWLSRIVTYAALKVIRKRKGLDVVSLEEVTDEPADSEPVPHPAFIADWSQTPEQLAQRNEVRRLLDDALDRLDEKHRLVFVLRDIEGLSVKETAEALGIGESNVKVRLLRARLQLREQLTQSLGDPNRRIEPGHAHSH